MPTLLLSDLHLPSQPSPLRSAFADFLAGPARSAQAVYILGDLFEYWIGDDVGQREYAPELAAMRALADSGVRLRFMHGNRDFLAGRGFAAASGAELLPDPLRIELCGAPTLLSHGDIFCTDDFAYQRWRRLSRKPLVQAIYRRLPQALRLRIAKAARAGSANKPAAIMDVNDAAVRQAFLEHGVRRIIHGHTHRPAEHHYELGGQTGERIVLADWRPQLYEYLICDETGWRRQRLDPG
jgi:UDP-2,3-diacylglucosamine hydrolase